jgi:hypothetical protein
MQTLMILSFLVILLISENIQANTCLKDKLLGFLGKSTTPPKVVVTKQVTLPSSKDQAKLIVKESQSLETGQINHIISKYNEDEDLMKIMIDKIHSSNTHDPQVLEQLKNVKVLNPETKIFENGLVYYLSLEEKAKNPAAQGARKQLRLLTGNPIALKEGMIDLDQQKFLAQDLISRMKGKLTLAQDLNSPETLEIAQMAELIRLQNPNLEGLSAAEKTIINNLAAKYESKMAPLRGKNIVLNFPGVETERQALEVAATLRSMGIEVVQNGSSVTIVSRTGSVQKNDDLIRFLLSKDGIMNTDPIISNLDPKELKKALNKLQMDQGKITFKDPIDVHFPGPKDKDPGLTLDEFINRRIFDPDSEEGLDTNWTASKTLKGGKGDAIDPVTKETNSSKSGFSSDPKDSRQIFWPRGKQGQQWIEGVEGSELRVAVNKVGDKEYVEVFVNTGESGKDNWIPMFYEKRGDKMVRVTKDFKGRDVPGSCVACHVDKGGRFTPIPTSIPNYKPNSFIGGDILEVMKREGGHH